MGFPPPKGSNPGHGPVLFDAASGRVSIIVVRRKAIVRMLLTGASLREVHASSGTVGGLERCRRCRREPSMAWRSSTDLP